MKTKRILIFAAALALAAAGAQAGDALVPPAPSANPTHPANSAAAGQAQAAPVLADAFVATAKVVGSSPIIETVYEPVEECKYELRRVGKSGAAPDKSNRLVGGVLGAAAGSAFGKGRGKDAAAAAGAVLGSEVGAQDGELSGGELVGGVAGGIIGNQIGSGSGRTAATAAGALLGSLLGDELENGPRRQAAAEHRKVRVCSYTERAKNIITGYNVIYEYNGHRFSGTLPYQPGGVVNIAVSAELLENRASRLGGECGSADFPCEGGKVGRVEYYERDGGSESEWLRRRERVEIHSRPYFVPYPVPYPEYRDHGVVHNYDNDATVDSGSSIDSETIVDN